VSERTLTRADLIEALQRLDGVSRGAASDFLEEMLSALADALARGEQVKLARFGNFVVREKRERVGRNPKTGVSAPIAPRRVVTFRASQILRDRVAGKKRKRS
jgi:integration host factor subunit alpha